MNPIVRTWRAMLAWLTIQSEKVNAIAKARALTRGDTAEMNVMDTLVAVILVTSTIGIVAANVTTAKNDSNLSTGEAALVGLLLLVFILGPVIYLFNRVRS